ncbi:SRPBCC family protein [Jeongeupia wiesaeckerbachi]|uniref:SRPBCC family protein n=1 Tax=Jeongeupia wiesaeckerbachi TaxID=3051218 RepID=UPI003D805D77
MRFEHLIEVNDANNPAVVALTIEQLWQGLMQRVEAPQRFLEHIERVAILERGDGWLLREVDFGQFVVRDRITLALHAGIRFDTEANAEHLGGALAITLESPEEGHLFLRFVYDTPVPEPEPGASEGEVNYAAYLKAAYRQMDIDMMRHIREWAVLGQLS